MSEVVALKVSDIDSKRMAIRIEQGSPNLVIEQKGPQLSFNPAPTVVSSAKVDVGSIRWIVGLRLLRAFRRFPYKLRRCECGRLKNVLGSGISHHKRAELSISPGKSKWIIGPVSPSGGRPQSRSFDNCFRIAVASQTRGSEVGTKLSLETIAEQSDRTSSRSAFANATPSLTSFHFVGQIPARQSPRLPELRISQRLQEI